MNLSAINFKDKLAKFSDHWAPKVIAQMNDYQFKLVKIQGEFVWHSHGDTDEVFIVLAGEMTIQLRDGSVHLKTGEMCVIPKGVEHKPVAQTECKIMLVEPRGVVKIRFASEVILTARHSVLLMILCRCQRTLNLASILTLQYPQA